jgi:hypothetical protein
MKALMVSVCAFLLIFSFGCRMSGPDAANTADTIYYGGDIITVNDAQPTVEAIAVKDGKILLVGTREEIGEESQGREHPDG